MIQKLTPAVFGGCITMVKGGGSITSWVDTVVVQARDVGALNKEVAMEAKKKVSLNIL